MIKKTSWSCNKPLVTSLSSRSVRFSASLQLEDFSRHSRFQAPELEEAIRKHFLPALLGVPSVEIDGDYRQLLTHSVKLGGWQSATLWTPPHVFTRPLLRQLVT